MHIYLLKQHLPNAILMAFFFNTSENQPIYGIIENIKDGKKRCNK